ncbi:MAG: hypothetical protein AMXMBFR64_44290 [Myxococcales bacterium]
MTNLDAPKAHAARRRTRAALIVVASMAALVGVGLVIVSRYEASERAVAQGVEELGERGRTLDAEGCVDAVLDWSDRCAGMKSLCDASVPRVMGACLAAQDRRAWCASLGDRTSDTHFGYRECAERGVKGAAKKKCAMTYRAIDSYCKQPSAAGTADAVGPARPWKE